MFSSARSIIACSLSLRLPTLSVQIAIQHFPNNVLENIEGLGAFDLHIVNNECWCCVDSIRLCLNPILLHSLFVFTLAQALLEGFHIQVQGFSILNQFLFGKIATFSPVQFVYKL